MAGGEAGVGELFGFEGGGVTGWGRCSKNNVPKKAICSSFFGTLRLCVDAG